MNRQAQPGAMALVGSGEYTPAMNETDTRLLATLSAAPARVVVIPTASGLEQGMPQRWNERGMAHFQALGAQVSPVALISRDDAYNSLIVTTLQAADLFYFSGGNPEYLIETLHDTPAWEAILEAHQAGAVLAGCSAGAMMMGGYTLRIRSLAAGQPPRWQPGLAVVPGLVVLPHFDRISSFVGPELFRQILAAAPATVTLAGIDEDTALVGLPLEIGTTRWQVSGRQSVSIFAPDGSATVYWPGETVTITNNQ